MSQNRFFERGREFGDLGCFSFARSTLIYIWARMTVSHEWAALPMVSTRATSTKCGSRASSRRRTPESAPFAKRDLSICYPAIAPRGHFRESRLRARANRRRRRFRERRRSGHRHRARDRAERARARPPGPSRPQPTRTLVPRGDGGEEGDARAHAPPRWRTRSREGRRSARWERDVSSGARPRPGARRSRARAPRVRVSPRAPPPWRRPAPARPRRALVGRRVRSARDRHALRWRRGHQQRRVGREGLAEGWRGGDGGSGSVRVVRGAVERCGCVREDAARPHGNHAFESHGRGS